MANSGVSKLAQVIAERIASQTQRPDVLELGTIQPDMSLKIDRFAVPIPKGDYLVLDLEVKMEIPQSSRVIKTASPVNPDGSDIPNVTGYSSLTRIDFNVQNVGDPAATVKVHLDLKSSLKPGDRVLVAWINDHTDPVILAKVVSS